uniref:eEF-1B gamma n=1 Tax=Caenorhabditis tropicalis TaxID=1561998 RepID=A0A1I7V4Q8_9PELO
MTGKLYGNKDNFRTQKVLIAAKLANKSVTLAGETAPIDKFPTGVTPAYEGDALLFGAESIGLHLTGTSANAETVQWLQFAEGYLLPAVLGYVLPSVSATNFDKKVVEQYKHELNALLKTLDQVLVKKTYLVGERLSLADVSVALDLLPAFQHVLDASSRKAIVNVTRWFRTVVNQPAVKEVLGEVALATSVAQFDQTKFNALTAKVAKSAPKAEKPKKEAKPAPAAAADAEDDEPKEEKSKDPFAEMPKGTFNLDNFKRSYSNEDTATKAIPHFWENFDTENWSIWKCEYKYPEDLTLSFMSCNLINGMYQRLEKLKKNAFASMILFGSDNNSTISGIWVWKGDKLAFELSPDWQVDYESYTWTKLDAKSEATKKEVNEYLLWEGDFGGKKFNQGKIFK